MGSTLTGRKRHEDEDLDEVEGVPDEEGQERARFLALGEGLPHLAHEPFPAGGHQLSDTTFNWLVLISRIPGAQREVLEDTVERIVRIYDLWNERQDRKEMLSDIEDVMDELRRDIC